MELTVRGLLNDAIKPMIEVATCPDYVPDFNDTSVVDFSEGESVVARIGSGDPAPFE